MRKINYTILLLAGALCTSQVWANEQTCSANERNYQQCDNQLGWYIGGDVGIANTRVSDADIDLFFQQSQLNANSVRVDNDDTSWSAFFGYQFNRYFSLELGYLDLGKRSVDFTGKTSDLNSFYDSVEHVYPQSVGGVSANLVVSYPFADNFKVSGKLGYFDWRGSSRTSDDNNEVGRDRISDQDLWYGVELNYRLIDNWQTYTGFSRIKLSRDTNTVFSLGVRYYF